VLLLQGFFQTRNVWEVMEDRLRYDGFGVLSFDLGGLLWRFNTRSSEDLAALVSEKVERVCARYDLDRVHVIGHSKGGLVGRSWIRHHGGNRRARSLITLGTAHHAVATSLLGMPVADWGLPAPLDRVTAPPLLRRLADDEFPPEIPLVSIYSRSDLVCPWPASVLRPRPGTGSIRNVCVQGVGHTALTTDSGVYRMVREELLAAARLWKERAGGGAGADYPEGGSPGAGAGVEPGAGAGVDAPSRQHRKPRMESE
jgi:triacylglycerol lipase